MKLLILCSTLDLTKPYGSTPALWQLFKGLSENGNELIIMPYHGHSIDSLWWKSLRNPNYYEGEILQRLLKLFRSSKRNKSKLIPLIAKVITKPKIEKVVLQALEEQKNIDAMILINIPLNQIKGMPTKIKSKHKIPILLYDIDVPTSLPTSGGFTFNHYLNADLSEYDSFIIPSEGSIESLKEIGAQNVDILHFGIDPDVYNVNDSMTKDIDLFFYGNGGKDRMNYIKMMVTEPSYKMNKKFLISGNDFNFDIGKSEFIPLMKFNEWKKYCSRSKINLNVVREKHANIYATSTSRPFELAAMKCCIVSSPYKGLEKWFDIGNDIIIVNSSKEAIEAYQDLLQNKEKREKLSIAAYTRVIKEHTAKHRGKDLVNIINKYQ